MSKTDSVLEQACEMLLRENSDVDSVARHFGLSREHLSRTLKTYLENRFNLKLNGKPLKLWMKENYIELSGKDVSSESFESDLLDQWSIWLKPSQKGRYSSYLKALWQNCFNRKNLENLNENDMTKFLSWIGEKEVTSSVRRNFLNVLRSWIRFGGCKHPNAHDWLERYLKTNQSGFEKVKKHLRFIANPEFYGKWIQAKTIGKQLCEKYRVDPEEWEFIVDVKTASGIRTGDRRAERELWGTKCGKDSGKSFVYKFGDSIYWHVFAKKRELWDITLLPKELWNRIRTILEKRKEGEYLISTDKKYARIILKEACRKIGIPELTLHDLRHIYATWQVKSGQKLEYLADLNVGWRDVNTLKGIYLEIEGYEEAKPIYEKFSSTYFSQPLLVEA